MTPAVSILCPTYARTALLAEVVESFRRQDYDGDLELVVLNDCPLQTLVCNVPRVRSVTMPRYPTFGDKKNHGIRALCKHDLLMVWDDDDLYLPAFVRTVVAKLRAGEPAARLRHMVQWTGDAEPATRRSSPAQHSCVFRRSAFDASGGWPSLEAGRADRAFWFRVIPQWFRGRHHHEADGHLLNIYRADSDRPHMWGTDPPPLTERQYQEHMDARILSGEEPRGVVMIEPRWSRDWISIAASVDAGGKASHD